MPLAPSVAHPQWHALNMHVQMCPACASSCPVLSGSCLCTLPGVMARFIFWSSENSAMGLGGAHSPEFATEIFAIWKQNKPLLSGILLSVFKAPCSPDFFLYKAVLFKNSYGTKNGFSGWRGAGPSKMEQWVIVLPAKLDDLSLFPGSVWWKKWTDALSSHNLHKRAYTHRHSNIYNIIIKIDKGYWYKCSLWTLLPSSLLPSRTFSFNNLYRIFGNHDYGLLNQCVCVCVRIHVEVNACEMWVPKPQE